MDRRREEPGPDAFGQRVVGGALEEGVRLDLVDGGDDRAGVEGQGRLKPAPRPGAGAGPRSRYNRPMTDLAIPLAVLYAGLAGTLLALIVATWQNNCWNRQRPLIRR